MKVVLNSVEGKVNLLKMQKLKEKEDGGWLKIFIPQDLTPRQKEGKGRDGEGRAVGRERGKGKRSSSL